MKKEVTHRIAYYTRKVAQFGAIHPAVKRPRSHKYRHQRLMQYKAAMFKLIDRHHSRVSKTLKAQ